MRLYFGLIGVLFLAGAVLLLVRRMLVAGSGVSATGTIVNHEKRLDDEVYYYLPVVTFIDREGKQHSFTSPAGDNTPLPAIGTTVTVRYLPEDPGTAYIVSFLHMWAAPAGMFVLGAVALAVSLQD